EALVSAHLDLVASITTAHRLTEADALEVGSTVWHLLERNLHKLRQPDQVGAWLAAVTRDECVRVLTSPG
ncbi:MAG TPA: hypothetical protein VGR90_10055, partial [Acidimicrobiales bacterium]|nr:hypothetical protein [Acidimicrobiales bacterium]